MDVFKSMDFVNPHTIEISNDFVVWSQRTSLFQRSSKEIRISHITAVNIFSNGLLNYTVEIKSWTDSVVMAGFTKRDANRIRELIRENQEIDRQYGGGETRLDSIKIGDQIWTQRNLEIHVANESSDYTDYRGKKSAYGLLYTLRGAFELVDSLKGWRIPTQNDYERLFTYYKTGTWNNLVRNANFKLGGYYSPRFNHFNGIDLYGMYWTNTMQKKHNMGNESYYNIKIVVLEENFKSVSIKDYQEDGSLSNDRYSLRLIK